MSVDKHSFSLRLEPELYRALNALAGVRASSLSKLITDLLTEGWDRAPEKEGLIKIIAANTPAATPTSPPKKPAAKKASKH